MLKNRMPSEKMMPDIHGTAYGSMRLLRLNLKSWIYLSQRPEMRYPTWMSHSQQMTINLQANSGRWIKVWTYFRTFKMITRFKKNLWTGYEMKSKYSIFPDTLNDRRNIKAWWSQCVQKLVTNQKKIWNFLMTRCSLNYKQIFFSIEALHIS